MKRTRTVQRLVAVEETVDILCNKCGKTCRLGQPALEPTREGYDYGLIEATVGGKYHSEALCDMTGYTFSLCEPCLKALFDACVIPPKVVSDGEVIDYDPNWKEASRAAFNAYRQRCQDAVLPFLPAAPDGWSRLAEHDGFRFVQGGNESGDQDKTTVHCHLVGDNFRTVISRHGGETLISMDELRRLHKLFAPWIALDTALKGVHLIMKGDMVVLAEFTKKVIVA